jgi:multicomponent Na+:H+ antiporter subunit C
MAHADHALAVVMLLVGLHGVLASRSLVRKLMALGIVQVAVIVLFVALGAKSGAQPPVVADPGTTPRANAYVNPLPHALMLTAIVVGVSTTGVALALLLRIDRRYDTLDEAELAGRLGEER